MKFFIEVLLEKSVVTHDQVCEALILQASRQPSIIELVEQTKLLNTEQIVMTCLRQARDRSSFQGACQALGFWTPALEANLERLAESRTTTLVNILREQGHLDSEIIINTLGEVSAAQPDQAQEPEPIAGDAPIAEASANNQSMAPVESGVAPSSFIEFLGDDLRQQLQRAQTDLKSTTATAAGWAELGPAIFHFYHQIKGSSRFLGEALLEKLSDEAETLIEIVGKSGHSLATASRETIVSTLELIFEAIWKIRDCRAEGRSLPQELVSIAERACTFSTEVVGTLNSPKTQIAA